MRVLLATDGSDQAGAAMSFLETLPLPPSTEVRISSVIATPNPVMGGYPDAVPAALEAYAQVIDAEREACSRATEQAQQHLAARGYQLSCQIREGDPAHEILEAAQGMDADLIVVGARAMSGIEEFFLGSVARNVAKHSQRPVLVARAPQNALRSIVFATDGSEHAKHAAGYLARLPLPEDTVVTVVHAVRPQNPFPGILPTDPEEFRRAAEAIREQHEQAGRWHMAQAESILHAGGKKTEHALRIGDPSEEILAVAKEKGADLVVAGARGVSLIKGLLVGSVAERLLRQTQGSVLLIH